MPWLTVEDDADVRTAADVMARVARSEQWRRSLKEPVPPLLPLQKIVNPPSAAKPVSIAKSTPLAPKVERLPEPEELSSAPRGKLHQIMRLACEYYELNPEIIRSTNRSMCISLPRQVVMYLCRACTIMSIPAIGMFMHRDHTTIVHGYDKIRGLLEGGNEKIKADVAILKAALKSGILPTHSPAFKKKPLKKHRHFTSEELDRIRGMLESDFSISEIAHALSRPPEGIGRKLRDMGLGVGWIGVKFTEEEDNKIREMVSAGKLQSEIGRALNRSRASVGRRITRLGLQNRIPHPQYSAQDEDEIRRMFLAGRQIVDIARKIRKTSSAIRWKLHTMNLRQR